MSYQSINDIQEQVLEAYRTKVPRKIVGADSKNFYGYKINASPIVIDVKPEIIDYEPTELVITASASTPIADIQKTLAQHQQMLAFEPPDFNNMSSIGGTIACGFSGPRRPFTGSARDYTLGITCINGKGEMLKLGGKVMKNVAGYDASRLMVGSLGTLAVVINVSLKVVAKPAHEISTVIRNHGGSTIDKIKSICNSNKYPLSAVFADDSDIYIRLSGPEAYLQKSVNAIGGEILDHADLFWSSVANQTYKSFNSQLPLWRVSVPPATDALSIRGTQLIDWGGALRWILTEDKADSVRQVATAVGGQAILYKPHNHPDNTLSIFHPLSRGIASLHKKLKLAFDPENILNPGHMYLDL